MTASITFGPRHPAYLAGHERCKNPTGKGNPYPVGSDDYAMWRLGFTDMLTFMRATGRSEIEEIVE